jgi:hypothetical protein
LIAPSGAAATSAATSTSYAAAAAGAIVFRGWQVRCDAVVVGASVASVAVCW